MEKVRLKDIGTIVTGNTPSKKKSEYYINKEICFFKPSDIKADGVSKLKKSEEYISEKARNKVRMLPKNSVLVTCIGTIGKVGIIEKEACCNQQINAIIPNNNINSKYLAYSILSKKYWLQRKANAPVVPIINKSEFSNIEILIQNIEEQNVIVKQLDKTQEIIDLRKKQIEELDKLIKSQFVEMFQSGNYPKEELGKLCDVRDGTHDSPKYIEESEYKFITSKNIINNEIDFSEVKYISKKDYDKFNTRSKVSYGDILMPMIGTIGKPMIVDIPDNEIDFAIKNVALIKFLDNSQVTNIYIKNLLDSDYFENAILQNKRGGTQKFIALSDIRKMQIEIPPIEIQNQFAEIVKQIDKQKFIIEISLKETEEIQESLMNKYFG